MKPADLTGRHRVGKLSFQRGDAGSNTCAWKVSKARRQKEDASKAEEFGLTRQLLQVPLQGLVLSLASRKFSQQLLKDVGLKLVDTLKERMNDFSKSQFQASCRYSYPETWGLV
jgi:hypothetical protein